MKKLIVLVVLAWVGAAGAQPAPTPAAGTAAEEPAAPTAEPPAPAADAAPIDATANASPEELRKVCAAALNANPDFAKSIVETFNKKAVQDIDQQTIEAHQAAAAQIAENERHVIYAYAVMWIFAALFLVYMWLRQQSLKTELASLRRELEAAAKESP